MDETSRSSISLMLRMDETRSRKSLANGERVRNPKIVSLTRQPTQCVLLQIDFIIEELTTLFWQHLGITRLTRELHFIH